jgi:hypothetical protein
VSKLDYPAIRSRIPIRRVLELLRYQPALQRGPQWRGPCPICSERVDTANQLCFSVHVGRNLFQCFRCQRSGNQLDLWACLSARSLYPATLDLCRRLDIEPIPLANPQPPNHH